MAQKVVGLTDRRQSVLRLTKSTDRLLMSTTLFRYLASLSVEVLPCASLADFSPKPERLSPPTGKEMGTISCSTALRMCKRRWGPDLLRRKG